MRILVFGANGQVGTELRRRGASAGFDIAGVDIAECDLTASGAAAAAIAEARADAVVNAAAYTAVDKAETDETLALRLNAGAPAEMAAAAAKAGIPFIHYSTDYVFDGTATRPYREDDPTSPLGAYGRTKRAGEEGVAAAGGRYAILRTSWVFSAHGSNFVKTMLRLAAERPRLRVVADQRGKPTSAAALADAALRVAGELARHPGCAGLYHVAGDEETSWADFAAAIVEAAGIAVPVDPITTAEYPTPARRPAYSTLDTAKFEKTFGLAAPSWRADLAGVVAELNASAKETNR